MKTAEEWTIIRNEMADGVIVLLSEEEREREFASFVKQIQLDAWKQGMTDAANLGIEIGGHAPLPQDASECLGCKIVRSILTARDNKTTI